MGLLSLFGKDERRNVPRHLDNDEFVEEECSRNIYVGYFSEQEMCDLDEATCGGWTFWHTDDYHFPYSGRDDSNPGGRLSERTVHDMYMTIGIMQGANRF